MRKPDFCICENKGADQMRFIQAADQCPCFRYIDSTISLFPKSEIPCLWPSSVSVAVQPVLCLTWLETPKKCFLAMQNIIMKTSTWCSTSKLKMSVLDSVAA